MTTRLALLTFGLATSLAASGCERALDLDEPTNGAINQNGSTAASASATTPGSCATSVAPVSMPSTLLQTTAVAGADGRIYVLGGQFVAVPGSQQWAYAPSTGVWTRLPDLPGFMHTDVFAASVGQTVYLLGDETFAFDLVSQTWSTKSPGPGGAYAAGPDGKIYASGNPYGQPDGGPPTLPARYDPTTDTWETLADQAGLAWGEVATFIGRTFYVFNDSDAAFGYDIDTNTWKQLAAPSPSREEAMGGALGQRILLAGGYASDSNATLVSSSLYDPTTDSWSAAASMATPVAYTAGTTGCDGRFYIFGGNTAYDDNLAVVQVYDPATNTWESSQ